MRRNSRAAEAKVKNGRVIVRLPRNWYDGKQKIFSLGVPDSLDNMAMGGRIANQINLDYQQGKFDRSFKKYLPSEPIGWDYFEIAYLWVKYCDYKSSNWKAKTLHYNQLTIGRWMEKLPPDWRDALAVREYLMHSTTRGITVRVLQSIESCIEWAMRVGLIESQINPYRKMATELKAKGGAKAKVNAFSPEHQEQLISEFYQSPIWSQYGQFVEFLFLTGCRPSEAIGLHWEQISDDCTKIIFDRSVVKVGKDFHLNDLSKTNRSREFPCSDRLITFLKNLQAHRSSIDTVFTINGQYINYESFYNRPWKKTADQVTGRKTTPYSARDTFITRQIEKGKPIAIVARWVDNSTEMIEKNYLDTAVIKSIRPE